VTPVFSVEAPTECRPLVFGVGQLGPQSISRSGRAVAI